MRASDAKQPLVQVADLKKYFPVTGASVFGRHLSDIRAVDGVSFEIYRSETLGLVGESGCGKSTTGRTILQLYRPTAGDVRFDGVSLVNLKQNQLRQMRRRMQMIFQDPYAALSPRMTVAGTVGEPLEIYGLARGQEKQAKVDELLDLVGLHTSFGNRYPHELSGGQRQRVGIARALALKPDFIMCDEPVSALDVSIQAQIINLLQEIQERFGLTYLFIAHDLSIVRHISDRVAVMYLGKIVELADSDTLYTSPLHPYTQALLSAVPRPRPASDDQPKPVLLRGDIPSPSSPPRGCNFNTRCPLAIEACFEVDPDFKQVSPGHSVACHLVE